MNNNLMLDKRYGDKTISLVSSSKCNLGCSYCFLTKDESYKKEDELIIKALKEKTFIKNIVNSLDRLRIPKTTFVCMELWGGETSLHLDLLSQNIPEIMKAFPNLMSFSYSTNFTTDYTYHTTFLEELDKNCNANTDVRIQISMDGPPEVLKQTRFIDYNIIKENLKNFIEWANKKDFNNINKILIHYKATLPWYLYKNLFSTKEGIYSYVKFYDDELIELRKLTKNKVLEISDQSGLPPTLALPYECSPEDGILYASIARNFDLIDFSDMTYFKKINFPIYSTLPQNIKDKVYDIKDVCGQVMSQWVFRWDGSVCPCNSSIMDDRIEHQNIMKERNQKEYEQLKKITPYYLYPNDPNVTDEQLQERLEHMVYMWEGQPELLKTNIAATMYDLAIAKEISPIYEKDMTTLYRHANYLYSRVGCYYYNVRKSGSPYSISPDIVRLHCNGLLEYYDSRKEEIKNED